MELNMQAKKGVNLLENCLKNLLLIFKNVYMKKKALESVNYKGL